MVNYGPKIVIGKFQKEYIRFKLRAILSSMMNSHTVLLQPAQDVSHPSVQHLNTVYASHPLVT